MMNSFLIVGSGLLMSCASRSQNLDRISSIAVTEIEIVTSSVVVGTDAGEEVEVPWLIFLARLFAVFFFFVFFTFLTGAGVETATVSVPWDTDVVVTVCA